MIYLSENIQTLFTERKPTLLNLLVKIYGIQQTLVMLKNTNSRNAANYYDYLTGKVEEMRKVAYQDINNLQIVGSGFLIYSTKDNDKLLEITLDNYKWEHSFAFHHNIFMIFAELRNYREIASIADKIEAILTESNMSERVLSIDNFNNDQITNILTLRNVISR